MSFFKYENVFYINEIYNACFIWSYRLLCWLLLNMILHLRSEQRHKNPANQKVKISINNRKFEIEIVL